MYLGYSRKRLERYHMPEHKQIREFADKIAEYSGYKFKGESPLSRVVCLERNDEI
jgi:tRNA wybutosine-synthesizing protein 1